MATVKVIHPRVQEAHFGLYRTSAGGDESIVIRRKIADPTDYMHTHSRKLQRQRQSFTLATKHYAQLTPSQKAITRHQIEEVEYQQSHGKTDTKLLMGRQLFIAKEIRSLNVTQKQLTLPFEVCILLTDPDLNPLEGQLALYFKKDGDWQVTKSDEIALGNWLFSQVPAGKSSYHPYGEVIGYYDPENPATTYLTEAQLKQYHYHMLYPTGIPEALFDALGTSGHLLKQADDYHEARDATEGIIYDTGNTGTAGQSCHFGDFWRIWRAGLFFNTTALLASHTIVEAYLRLKVAFGGVMSGIADDNQHLRILNGQGLDPTGLKTTDYSLIGSRTTAYGEVIPDDWTAHANELIDIPISHSLIVKEGITKIALRGTHDINNFHHDHDFWNNRYDWQLPARGQSGQAWLRIKYLD